MDVPDRGLRAELGLTRRCRALVQTSTGRSVWRGPLLPGFWLQVPGGGTPLREGRSRPGFHRARARGGHAGTALAGHGRRDSPFQCRAMGNQFHELRVTWDGTPPAILGLYFGSAPLTEEQRTVVPSLESRSGRVGVRRLLRSQWQGRSGAELLPQWDLGHATFPLGSFGPSLGTPYAAAFPRPMFSAAMAVRTVGSLSAQERSPMLR